MNIRPEFVQLIGHAPAEDQEPQSCKVSRNGAIVRYMMKIGNSGCCAIANRVRAIEASASRIGAGYQQAAGRVLTVNPDCPSITSGSRTNPGKAGSIIQIRKAEPFVTTKFSEYLGSQAGGAPFHRRKIAPENLALFPRLPLAKAVSFSSHRSLCLERYLCGRQNWKRCGAVILRRLFLHGYRNRHWDRAR
jgi:hypothetical protein